MNYYEIKARIEVLTREINAICHKHYRAEKELLSALSDWERDCYNRSEFDAHYQITEETAELQMEVYELEIELERKVKECIKQTVKEQMIKLNEERNIANIVASYM